VRGVLIAVVIAIIAVIGLCWPVCEPLDDEAVRTMDPPMSVQRNTRTLWFKSYEICGRHWCQCKPWVERKLFF
jgi:hypothetical protein